MTGRVIIIMGVSGSGKSTIGDILAEKLGYKFIDGDDLHPKANIQKMASGNPLNDEDRSPWLERIRDACYSLENKNEQGIIVCSALKKKYRDQIRDGNKKVIFLFLNGSFDLLLKRMESRTGHFMKASMLQSQFNTLEVPINESDVITIDIDKSIDEIIKEAVLKIK